MTTIYIWVMNKNISEAMQRICFFNIEFLENYIQKATIML